MRIALTGPMYSGKSTVAKILEGVYDYTYVNFTRQLKNTALQALAPYVDGLTVEMIEKEKTKYRSFLQELGTVIGYDDNPKYITDLIGDEDNIVFDNVRYDGQWETLDKLGFRLVRLDMDTSDIIRRAEHMGVSTYRIREQLNHVSENSLNYSPYITYDASRSSAETIARLIVEDKPQPAPKRQHRGNYEVEVTQGHRYTRSTETPRPDRLRGTTIGRITLDEATMMQGPDGEVPVMAPVPNQRRYLTPSAFSATNDHGYSHWFTRESTPAGHYVVPTSQGPVTYAVAVNEDGDVVATPVPQEVARELPRFDDDGLF